MLPQLALPARRAWDRPCRGVLWWRGDALLCLGLGILSRARKPAGGCFEIKSKIWAMGISTAKPQAAFRCQHLTCHEFPPSPRLVPP